MLGTRHLFFKHGQEALFDDFYDSLLFAAAVSSTMAVLIQNMLLATHVSGRMAVLL